MTDVKKEDGNKTQGGSEHKGGNDQRAAQPEKDKAGMAQNRPDESKREGGSK